jgi:hypothetical protein
MFNCLDCGVDTNQTDEYYMVNDDVWVGMAGMGSKGMLCVDDLEKRMGRNLTLADFTRIDSGVNYRFFQKFGFDRFTTV